MLHSRQYFLVNPKAPRLTISTDSTLSGPPGAFASFAPITTGARVVVASERTGRIVDAALPAVAFGEPDQRGWRSNAGGTAWTYRDETAQPVEGIVKVTVKDRSAVGRNRVKLKVKGYDGPFEVSPFYLPLGAAVVLGDETDGAAGVCAEPRYAAADCRAGTFQLSCKR